MSNSYTSQKSFINQWINSLPSSKSTGFSSAFSFARFFSFFLFLISSAWFSFPLPFGCLDEEFLLLSLEGDFSKISCFFSFSCFANGSEVSFLFSFWDLVARDLLAVSLLCCSLIGDASCLFCFCCFTETLLDISFAGDFSMSCLLSFVCFSTTLLEFDFELAASVVFCFVSTLSSFPVVTCPLDWDFYNGKTKTNYNQFSAASALTGGWKDLRKWYNIQSLCDQLNCIQF